MPPRLPSSSIASSTSAVLQVAGGRPAATSASARNVPLLAVWQGQSSSSFSSSANCQNVARGRRDLRKWLRTKGKRFRTHQPGQTNYLPSVANMVLSNRPFPLNPHFKSEPVLDDRARELIWEKVIQKGATLKEVSAEYGVDVQRVSAIVRLKEVEKQWLAQGKKLAKPYCKAVLEMLPTKTIRPDRQNHPFEPINELHVHNLTMKQLFWPTSESRHFTRADAAKAFHKAMLPADERVPVPELIKMEKDLLDGRPALEAKADFIAAVKADQDSIAEKKRKDAEYEKKVTTSVKTDRFEFRFKKFNAENVGPKGRNPHAVGSRYGRPSYDRMKGMFRIPTSVPEKTV